ncbi:unnamed protein product [Pseudo-nitzschia multistriata]|uniref:Uncharacterized protein n=1 Tax=Pseudo-nitzschia multistriata TaxID=183589 RepID=A0A448Z5H6_9STRA|nr:unnamed protein product [Pseudo-nitzschia multistriata]
MGSRRSESDAESNSKAALSDRECSPNLPTSEFDGAEVDQFDDEYGERRTRRRKRKTYLTVPTRSPAEGDHGQNASETTVDGDGDVDGAAFGIDHGAVRELAGDVRELRRGLAIVLVLFVLVAGLIALDDYFNGRYIDATVADGTDTKPEAETDPEARGNPNENNTSNTSADGAYHGPPYPRMGHKLRINASAFTANDFECLRLDTGNWPSERVHCELLPGSGDERYEFVVEHFDDEGCQAPNAQNPVVRHTASGCFYYEAYNHSYNDLCHPNRTFTVSAFFGRGCLDPMPVTAVNLLPEGEGAP